MFSNEAFTIGMLQAVSGAAVFGLLTQLSDLGDTIGSVPIQIVLTAFILALALSVGSAYCKHQYKMWDVKAAVTDNVSEALRRSCLSGVYLKLTRTFMAGATLLIIGALIVLLVALWYQ
ncbi:MAG: hypothetical protein Q8L63_04465 [Alphaproteobacteria bacterium]|nr:hypothetical protein [Alphaproteobacteria bacterium]